MRLQWYFCSLVLSLALVGVVQQHCNQTPNQEIVLQFESNAASLHDIEYTLKHIKTQLSHYNVDNINIVADANGLYTLTYYSATDVATIKAIISERYTNHTKGYAFFNFDVFEIKSSVPNYWDFEGPLVFNSNPKSNPLSEVKLLDYFGYLQNNTSNSVPYLVNMDEGSHPLCYNTTRCGSAKAIRAGPKA